MISRDTWLADKQYSFFLSESFSIYTRSYPFQPFQQHVSDATASNSYLGRELGSHKWFEITTAKEISQSSKILDSKGQF